MAMKVSHFPEEQEVIEMRFLRQIINKSKRDKIQNDHMKIYQ